MNRPFAFLFPVAIVLAAAAVAPARAGAGSRCVQCHDRTGTIAGTAHSALSCAACHPKHETFPHPSGSPAPPCARCHGEVAAENRLGVHGLARARGNTDAPDCGACHGDAHAAERTGTEAFRRSVPEVCGGCHDQVFAEYRESVHGTAAAAGIVAAPVCSSCHGEHRILAPSKGASPVHPTRIPETCGRCHGDVRITERFRLPRTTLVSFEKSVHGLALRAGSEIVANCASCHGVHRILPSSDPRSTIYPGNLPRTCGKCHPGAGSRFAIGHIHWGEGAPPPLSVRVVRAAYWILIPLTIGWMFLHNAGDWVRKLVALRFGPAGRFEAPASAAEALGNPAFFRMFRLERIQHGILLASFLVLVWTGFALVHPEGWWARPLVAWEGRWAVRGTVHRIAGALLIGISLFHAGSLSASRTLRRHWMAMLPRASDLSEGAANFAYVVGLSHRRPRISFHSYAEKLEYWAVVWGTLVMAATGVMLWANTLVLTWLPKVALDVALAIHFYEAVLAALAILVWHIYMVLLDPMVYPMDPAWITGYSVRRRDTEDAREGRDAVVPEVPEKRRSGTPESEGESPSHRKGPEG